VQVRIARHTANPFWADHGVTLVDPDGFRVILVPESWQ